MKLISSISFIIIAIALFFLVVNPLYGEVKQLRTDVSTYNTALNNSTELQKTRDSLIEIYKSVKIEDRERLTHFLPSTIGNIELILEIEKIANLHGMSIGDIKFDKAKAPLCKLIQKPKYQDLIEDLDYSLEKITGKNSPNSSVAARRQFWSKVNMNSVVTKKI